MSTETTNLQQKRAVIKLFEKQVLDGGSVLVGESMKEEALDDRGLAHSLTAQENDPDAA